MICFEFYSVIINLIIIIIIAIINKIYLYYKFQEFNLMVKLIRTITLMALETIVQRIFIPNILLQNLMLLHSAILPNIKDEQVDI